MPRQDYGWTISSQRGGPGGCPFDDCQHLERATGGCADEWVLCEVEFFWWAAIGGMRTTCPCQTAVFTGSLKVTVPTGAPHRTGEPSTRVIEAPASLRSSRSCTRDLCQRSREQLRVSALEPQGQGVITGGQVVRAVAGRAGDSLDAISFVLGPPIPEMWTPKTHAFFPRRTRRAIYTVLLASMCRADCFWAKLDQDTLYYIFGLM